MGGRYVLGRREGQGGFSICYRAWDGRAAAIVAVKELFPYGAAKRRSDDGVDVVPSHEDSFRSAILSARHEASVLSTLDKEPAIVQVHEVFEDNDTVYLAMDYLRGKSYDRYLDDSFDEKHAELDVGSAINVALVVLGALEAVHERGLLHLDIKPANVRVLDDGSVVLLDFGSTRAAFRAERGSLKNTFTPGFAALEQHDPDGEMTTATDVHAVAALLHYSLSRVVPTGADARAGGEPLLLPGAYNPRVPEALDAVIAKALALDPAERYPSVAAFKEALWPFQPATGSAPLAIGPPAPLRAVAGLLDIAVAAWAGVALSTFTRLGEGAPLTLILILWGLLQLLPGLAGATPGMLLTRVRLAADAGGITLRLLLARTLLLLWTLFTFRFSTDAEGLMLHDRRSRSRVVRTMQVVRPLPPMDAKAKANAKAASG